MEANSIHLEEEDHTEYIGKTGKKRERATQACTPCRKKKKRCDGTKPFCRNCQEAGIDCAYAACKRRGPRKGYVQLLEERLAQLEKKMPGSSSSSSVVAVPSSSLNNNNSDGNNQHHNLTTPKIERSISNHGINISMLNEESIEDIEMPPQDIVLHLVNYFFKYINSLFPLLHHPTLIQSIRDGTVSQPLLWSVMAIGARFSDHPKIKTDPPYWAGEKFARKAGSLICVELFEPNVSNLQFWGVMACLEYGRAAGSRAWIYGGLASRLCFELGFHKKETERSPIYKPDGSLDREAMLMRRRIFWSCFNIDKFGSAGNSRPQFYNKGDFDVSLPDDEAVTLLNPPYQNVTIENKAVTADSLPSFIDNYLVLMEIFGDVIKGLQNAKSNQGKPMWPPMDDFDKLNDELQNWHDSLPDIMKFTQQNLEHHLPRTSRGKINYYLSSHIIWRTLVLALHRGSLAYVDQKDNIHSTSAFSQEAWGKIQYSVNMCKTVVNDVMPIFQAMKDICGINVIPYMGYSSYMFATILMTSTFTRTEEEHRKGSKGLALLFEMIELLRPYWPVCERLATTTRDLIVSHSRMYEYSQEEYYKRIKYESPTTPPQPSHTSYSPALSTTTPSSQTTTTKSNTTSTIPSSMTNILNSDDTSPRSQFLDQTKPVAAASGYPPPLPYSNQPLRTVPISSQQQLQQHHQQQQPQQQPSHISTPPIVSTTSANTDNTTAAIGISYPSYMTSSGVIDFNSSAFLYDTGLFGQIMFDESKLSYVNNTNSDMNNHNHHNNNNTNQSNNSNNNGSHNMFGFNDVQPMIYHPTTNNNGSNNNINNTPSNSISASSTGVPLNYNKRIWTENWQP
ncbi:fungal-specific transcription factor domain-containing protein [Cunninghamella echinulata]|nr:fungal-specific transcription factor domain-containing protein [Cunninghamella echinulata]